MEHKGFITKVISELLKKIFNSISTQAASICSAVPKIKSERKSKNKKLNKFAKS